MRRLNRAIGGGFVALLVVGWFASVGCASMTPVFQNGQAMLPIIVAHDAEPVEQAAALDLAHGLGVMAGIAWPLHEEVAAGEKGIYLGRTQASGRLRSRLKLAGDLFLPKSGEIGPDGFRIWTQEGSVFIEGATPEATGYAVAWLLQHEAGVRWYAPGETGEVIPRREAWSLSDLDLTCEPAYVSREISGLETPAGKTWARRNGLRSRLEFSHALVNILSPETLAAHFDWCPQLNGQRYLPVLAEDDHWQPNLALPDVSAFAAQAAAKAFERDFSRYSFSLGINDSVRFDQSEETWKLVEPVRYFRGKPDYSPLVFTFMNRAAETLTKTNPDRYLGCLAYFWCENTPSFRINPGVVPYVTTDRTQYYDDGYRVADLELMSRWGASGVRAFGLWEYAEGNNFIVPRVPCHALAEAVQEGWRRGARGYMGEVGPQWGFDEFKVWMLAQLLWDPKRTLAELADDFFPGYYGPAAEPMRRFVEHCEKQWMKQVGPPYWLKYYQQEDQALLFPPDVCRELRAMLDAAKVAAGKDQRVQARIARTSQAFAVTEAFASFDKIRRELAGIGQRGVELDSTSLKKLAVSIQRLVEQRRCLEKTLEEAKQGELPAMAQTELSYFVRNDPVSRLLWLVGQREPGRVLNLLKQAGPDAVRQQAWQALAVAIENNSLNDAKELVANGVFAETTGQTQEPRYLYPRSGDMPTCWEVKAMPTETGLVKLMAAAANSQGRTLRVEGAWDTQVFQWLPAEVGRFYVATAQLRGKSSPGNDSALFLTFLSDTGKVVGVHRMQSLPKGNSADWRTLVLADIAPSGAAWIGIGVGASRQVAGDWMEVSSVSLRGVQAETTR